MISTSLICLVRAAAEKGGVPACGGRKRKGKGARSSRRCDGKKDGGGRANRERNPNFFFQSNLVRDTIFTWKPLWEKTMGVKR
jgi:hypothetical protein